jgi:hypothetical protein
MRFDNRILLQATSTCQRNMILCTESHSGPNYFNVKFGHNVLSLKTEVPIPVAAQSRAWVCAHWLAEIVLLNPARGYGCLSLVSVVCCKVSAPG